MDSPGLKRPLDLQTNNDRLGGPKRRCTITLEELLPHPASTGNNSAFLNVCPSPSLNDHITSLIKNELHQTNNDQVISNELPVLTIRQTQDICEKVVLQRESKLRDEYDKILTSKVAEVYELLCKANQMKAMNESRYQSSVAQPPSNPSNPTMNALAAAAAYTHLQRTSAPAPGAPLPDLSTLANSLSNQPESHHLGLTRRQILAMNIHQQAANASAFQNQQTRLAGQVILPPNAALCSGPVLLVSNIDEQLATPEALFTLFGVFGDVMRVKILFNKNDNALIQMADSHQAQMAQGFLDKQRVYGKNIRVTRSKHQLVQMPRDSNQTDGGLTKDFTNSTLHRFKIPGSRNYLNIYPPSNTLHISNIPANIEESDLKAAFLNACTFECSSFKFFPKDRKMALMKFDSIEQATIALIKMHNFQISSENNLRVSFSKSVMQQ